MRLLDFLERRWPDVHRAYFRRLVLAEMVKVNCFVGTPYTTLRYGDVIDITRPPGQPPPKPKSRAEEESKPRIVHTEADAVVVDKPAGMTVDAALQALRRDRPDLSGLPEASKPVLRMEADASGLMLLALTPAAHETLSEAFECGKLHIEWNALVDSPVRSDHMTIDKWLGPDRNRPGHVRVYEAEAKKGRPAHTVVTVEEVFDHHTLVRAIPLTDRGHQLRVHLAAAHHPIIGDASYGAGPSLLVSSFKRKYRPRVGVRERPIVQRLCLHATRLVWQRQDQNELTIESPLPKAMRSALVRLRRYAEQ